MGARRWLTFGPVNFQPAELAKIAVMLAVARWFHRHAEKESGRPRRGYGLVGVAVPAGLTLLPAALILKQPDLGTALIVVAIGFTMILFAGVRWRTVALAAGASVLAAALALPYLKPYQRRRLESFLNPEGDLLGAGYHATQSMIAVGSGQGFGKGWGQGTGPGRMTMERYGHRFRHLETNLLHAGSPRPPIEGAVVTPVFQTANYLMGEESEYGQVRYIRLNNSPNHQTLHARLAAIESTEAALVTSSGMSAITSTIFALVRSGEHVIAHESLYGGAQSWLQHDVGQFGIAYTPVDATRAQG